jgi:hypothetical protein
MISQGGKDGDGCMTKCVREVHVGRVKLQSQEMAREWLHNNQ